MPSKQTPAAAAPTPKLGQRCSAGHEYAQRSETDASGVQVSVVFCPACEPLAPPTETPGGPR